MNENAKSELNKYFSEHNEVLKKFWATNNIDKVSDFIFGAYWGYGRVFAFGNGGSASEASHLVGELVGRFEKERNPYPATCLNSDLSVVTAIANDYGYDNIFLKQVQAHVRPGDAVIGFSTSGNSKNVWMGLQEAKEMGAITIGFTGDFENNMVAKIADITVVVPSKRTCIIQEMHLLAIHCIASAVEKDLSNV